MPESVARPWREERQAFFQNHPQPWDEETQRAYEARFTRRMEAWLDAGHGSCALRCPDLRSVVTESLHHFDGSRYDMDAWVIMPNHVHVLVRPREGWELSRLLHTWKSYTASEINRRQKRQGEFWMDESFDHIVRSRAQLEHYRRYIQENPGKALLHEGHHDLWMSERARNNRLVLQ